MKSLKHCKDISISVENITPYGTWVFVNGKEYFLSYEDYPYFILQDKFDLNLS